MRLHSYGVVTPSHTNAQRYRLCLRLCHPKADPFMISAPSRGVRQGSLPKLLYCP